MDSSWDAGTPYITLFGPDHLAYIAGLLIVLAALLTGRSWVRRHATGLRRAILGLSVAQFTGLYLWYFLETGFDVAEALPLHISRTTTILGLVFLITRRPAWLNVQFFFGLFAYATFVLPSKIYPVTHVIGWSFFVSHTINIALPIFAGIAWGWRPTVRGLWKAYGWFLVYFVAAVVVNRLVGGNYFYLRDRPLLKSLPSPWYELGALAATLAIFWIGYGVSRLAGPGARADEGSEPLDVGMSRIA
ncbi:hypothetical protein GCM10009785_07270 [Brooklawnia cerclae]|uniref:Integral membrane protein (TIGR02206 family) n=1 Tax=Brooklawnia cerclae TaxID=349934 RepID=A0ABX0SMP2_9ACTN|nr:putative integral membrane protein (TIGR02206 family) [Brooklawnia cerclae]